MTRIWVALVAAAVLGLAGCAQPQVDVGAPDEPVSGGAAGMCAQDQPDCVDTPQLSSDDPMPVDETGMKQFRKDARFYLGKPQDELNELIRIARIDDEQYMLTEDYQIGRITVELDDVEGTGTPIVTKSTVEMPDGPETFELKR